MLFVKYNYFGTYELGSLSIDRHKDYPIDHKFLGMSLGKHCRLERELWRQKSGLDKGCTKSSSNYCMGSSIHYIQRRSAASILLIIKIQFVNANKVNKSNFLYKITFGVVFLGCADICQANAH